MLYQAANYVLQLGSALLHLHRRSICHGDVKPENLVSLLSATRSGIAKLVLNLRHGGMIHCLVVA